MLKDIFEKYLMWFLYVLISCVPQISLAQAMQSGNYKIQFDSLNIGGGSSTSTNYSLEDTTGEVGSGVSSSGSYSMHAGFQQMQEVYLAVSAPSDLSLGSISGITGVGSEGTVAWQVTTDNVAGYQMTIQASSSPALSSAGDSFTDYQPSTSDPDYNFTVPTSSSVFGFSPEGSDVINRFRDNGVDCNTGTLETSGKCWSGFSTTPQLIVERNSGNQPNGTSTVVRMKAQNGTSHLQTAGNYSASITVTVTSL